MKKIWETLYSIIFVTAAVSYVALLVSVIFTWKMAAIVSLAFFVPTTLIILIHLLCTTDVSGTYGYEETMGLGPF